MRIDAIPRQPWGEQPPPAPPTATRAERRRVRSAWRSWGDFRPWYTREGDRIRAEIDLKDRAWWGLGSGENDESAAWSALQGCIERWQRDTVVEISPAAFRRWLHGRRRPSRV